jgi:hypothetical protein
LLTPQSPAADDTATHLTITEPNSTIDVSIPQPLPTPTADVREWITRAATALTHFYDQYPVKHVNIVVRPSARGAVDGGVEFNGSLIHISLGPRATAAALAKDWMLTHEMFHLSQPNVRGSYSWMSEGMADYLEPVARVRVGQITPEQFWHDIVEGAPQGLPQPGEGGLDQTHSWGRTYWGGELFWLMADIGVRQQTDNKKSVRDAAMAVLAANGDGSHTWTLTHLLTAYDKATGVTVFKDLHDELGGKPVQTDLPALWKSLGVISDNQKTTFDDDAPLANVRRGITEPEK